MENLCLKFPLLAKKILNHLDDETLINFKDASRINVEFLDNERFYWIRKINRYNCLIGELKEVWKTVVSRTPIELIKELAFSVFQFPQMMKKKYQNETLSPLEFIQQIGIHFHPLSVVTACKCTPNLCNHVMQRTGFNRPHLLWQIYDAKMSLKYIPNHTEIGIVYYD